MTLQELVQSAKLQNEKAFGKVPSKRATAIVRAVLAELKNQIKDAQEENVAVKGFGTFVIKPVAADKAKPGAAKTRISFRPGKPKGKDKQGD
ncbi:MAG: hypothetical protein EPN21_01980 [Methylococcaceae bacterium]|nr:MAG: hypothetical protein EPN21_01980 [Methylococcaceae bacterium]